LVADAEPLMRVAVKACLQRHGLMVCGEASDDQELLEVLARTMPDVCLLAPDVPVDGIRSTAALSARFPETAVVVFAPTETYEDVLRAVHAGARGYLRRDTPCRSLARALSGVVNGEAGFSGRTVDHLVRELCGPEVGFVVHARGDRVTLSQRQIQVLRQLARGATTADIARSLSISAVTVRRHCADTCRKLGAPDRATAVELVRGQLSAS
jgi:DNA-binding NarL/FixJ family response regulator